ncbi:hypothetical protein [Flavobacterium sp.]|uniref:hypothetical protein n=1 Tax=Flavobacterium sp. TaxID=239 RepID=UPI004048D242
MKLMFTFFLFLSLSSFCQETIALDSISKYEGKMVTICETVQSTFLTKSNTTMLNFGKPYPNQTFVVIIFGKDLINFSYKPSEFLKDKTICITGKVIMYKDTPEFIVKQESEILIQ